MPTISTCPRCQKPVAIPGGVASTALVRCPLCAAEYPLGEAVPPELIPVLVAADQSRAGEGSGGWEGVTQRHETAVEPRAEGEAEMALGHEEMATEAEETNEAAAVAVGQSGVAAMAAMAAMRSRQPGPASALKRAVEVVTGGLAGCLVAYYGLAAWFGPEFKNFGFPELPGVAWLTTEPVKGDPGGEKPAEKPAAAKPAQGGTASETPDAGKTPGNTATTPKAGTKPSSGTSGRAP